MTALWIVLWLASLALVGWRAYRRGRAYGAGDTLVARDAAYREGRFAAEVWARDVAASVLANQYPTSRGGRAILRAMGGSVPALPKRKTTEATK